MKKHIMVYIVPGVRLKARLALALLLPLHSSERRLLDGARPEGDRITILNYIPLCEDKHIC